MNNKIIALFFVTFSLFLLNGCVNKAVDYDYTAFRESKPSSILVVMPLNESNEINAGYGVLSKVTFPLAEAGYYVFPVVVVDEIFKQNGLTVASDIQAVNLTKLHEIFNSDAILYLNIKSYGSTYQVIQSDTRVTLEARLVDARNGTLLWEGAATASSLEQQSNNSLLVSLVTAVVEQISSTITDKSIEMADIAAQRLLLPTPLKHNGILYGPRSTIH